MPACLFLDMPRIRRYEQQSEKSVMLMTDAHERSRAADERYQEFESKLAALEEDRRLLRLKVTEQQTVTASQTGRQAGRQTDRKTG
jgi:hypothetical protein